MKIIDLCPRCHLIIPPERMMDSTVVCSHCGWVKSGREEKVNQKLASRFRGTAFILSLLLVASFIQVVTWDHFFLEVIPLKTRQFIGFASAPDLLRLSQICEERKNHSCSESALIQASRQQPKDLEILAQLGFLQFQLEAYDRAAYSLQSYFAQGGRNVKSAYYYARSLAKIGRLQEAAQYYEYVLEAKEESLQITVTQQYIELLRRDGQFARAVQVIESIRKKGSNAANFLDAELQDLRKKVQNSQGA